MPATAPATIAPAPPATAPPATAPPTTPGAIARVALQPSTSIAALNSSVTMTIYAENVVNMADVAAQLQYDPKILRIVNIVSGDLPGRNLAPLDLSKTVLDDAGRADMRLSRGSNGDTISGSGSLFTVVFQAIGRGNTSVAVSSLGITGPAGPVTANTPVPAAVSVQ
jgi:cohesin domain-containing protein